jgi:hypothetical protein
VDVADGCSGRIVGSVDTTDWGALTDPMSAGDVDGDGEVELIVGQQAIGNGVVAWVVPLSPGWLAVESVGIPVAAPLDDGADVLGDQDLDGDGLADLVVGMPGRETVSLLHAPFGGPVDADDGLLVLDPDHDGFGDHLLSVGDADGDGLSDVLTEGTGAVTLRRRWVLSGAAVAGASSDSLIASPSPVSEAIDGSVCAAGDVDGDGFADLGEGRWAYPFGDSEPSGFYLKFGPDYAWTSRSAIARVAGGGCAQGDFDGDGSPDLAVADYAGGAWVFDLGLWRP